MTSRYIQTNDIHLHCKVAGEGKLMILLHGFPEFWYSWRHQIPELAKHYKVVVPDMRGYNDSDKPKGIKNYRMELLMEDVRGLIHAFGEEKAIIVAHDWGGAVAWSLATYLPDVVEKLIVLNIPHPDELSRQIFKGNWTQLKKSWYILFFQLPFIPEFNIKRNLELFFKKAFRGWAHNKAAFTDEDIAAYVQAFGKKGALTGPINYYRAALRSVFSKQKGAPDLRVKAPVLMIWGEDDRALGKELTYNTQYYCEEEVQIKYIPDCSHWVQQEQPELVNQYILQFLGNLPDG